MLSLSAARCLESRIAANSGESANREETPTRVAACARRKDARGRTFSEIKLDRPNCAHADTECLPSSLETGQRRRRRIDAGCGGGRLNADRRVYVSIKPDARGINPRGRRGRGVGGGRAAGRDGGERDRSIALIETAVSPILMRDYHCRR